MNISIHAPPRGATNRKLDTDKRRLISIHAPPRGATGFGCPCRTRPAISIHAPPRGATLLCVQRRLFQNDFNSRPSARGDLVGSQIAALAVLFQFTPLREGRHVWLLKVRAKPLFQFTPLREGRLFGNQFTVDDLYISIHAPPRGATRVAVMTVCIAIFQFTPLREGRPNPMTCFLFSGDFNSRPSARGDCCAL